MVFNASNLNISDIWITPADDDQRLDPVNISHDPASERTSLTLPSSLKAGSTVKLCAEFDAKLTGDMMGYYRASWKRDGKEEYYSLTQFEVSLTMVPF